MAFKLVLMLSENWTLFSPRDLPALVRAAAEAEDAGFDGVLVSEHVALGRGSSQGPAKRNPREFDAPDNQSPSNPWPNSLVLLSAVAAATRHLRLIAGAVLAPLRHPILLAKELGTLDLLSEGRLVVLPTVSWHEAEYAALGVPFHHRGELLDEHLAAWSLLWRESPASFRGRHYSFTDVYLEPKPFRAGGPVLWFDGSSLHPRMLRRLVTYGSGFAPMAGPKTEDLERLTAAMRAAGRDLRELEIVGGISGKFKDANGLADLGEALAYLPRLVERGTTTLIVKPSQFIDEPQQIGAFCRELVSRIAAP
jgi:probable F420-dependent oxidoreductase